jgi:archaellum biogenesis ATPase FlaH
MIERIKSELNRLPKDFLALLILPREHYEDLNMKLLKYFIAEKKQQGAYLAMNRPYATLVKRMKKFNVDSSRLLFIDCISKSNPAAHNCVFLRSIESLTHIGICLEPVYKNNAMSFVVIDSLDALAIYHKPALVVKFARSIMERAVEHHTSGVLLGIHEDTDKQIIDELSMVVDKVIDVS